MIILINTSIDSPKPSEPLLRHEIFIPLNPYKSTKSQNKIVVLKTWFIFEAWRTTRKFVILISELNMSVSGKY